MLLFSVIFDISHHCIVDILYHVPNLKILHCHAEQLHQETVGLLLVVYGVYQQSPARVTANVFVLSAHRNHYSVWAESLLRIFSPQLQVVLAATLNVKW